MSTCNAIKNEYDSEIDPERRAAIAIEYEAMGCGTLTTPRDDPAPIVLVTVNGFICDADAVEIDASGDWFIPGVEADVTSFAVETELSRKR